ncbi:MAG: EAL domain-containing protein [Burkholderiaceae bacterium]|nr:EAL domain-containing protein [Burkholderiaceae bacterium]
MYVRFEKRIDVLNEERLGSYVLVDELRQSSDDLTHMARLYVVTGEPRFRQYYQDILDIRNGVKPRPERYDSVYWDFVVATGAAPRPDGKRAVALLDLMRQAGFTNEEFDILAQAKGMSDLLTRTEQEAMRLRALQGQNQAANHALALTLMHNADYLSVKAGIMQPIDRFHALMSERTQRAVLEAEHNATQIRWVLVGLALGLLCIFYRASQALYTVMGGTLEEVDRHIARMGRGDFFAPARASSYKQGTVLARLVETQAKLLRMADERDRVQIELQCSEVRLKEAQRLALLGNWELDLVSNTLSWSPEVYRIFEMDPALFGASYESFLNAVHPQDRDVVNQAYADSVRHKVPHVVSYRLQMADGRMKYVQQQCETFYDSNGQPLRSIGTVQDITASKIDALALERLNRDLRLLSDCNMALVRAQDEDKLLAEICRLCVHTGGYLMAWVGYAQHDQAHSVLPVAHYGSHDGGEYLRQANISWADVEHGHGAVGTAIRTKEPILVRDIASDQRMRPWHPAAMERGYHSAVSLPLINGTAVLGALTLYASEVQVFDAEEMRLLQELANDLAYGVVTLRTRAEHAVAKEQLEFLAHFDALTHLPNRTLLRDRFEQATLQSLGGPEALVALLYLDLDRFKQINDSLGYSVGDAVIVRVVELLQQCVPATATVSRLSGDEFVILLTDTNSASEIAVLAHAIRSVFSDPVKVDEHTLNISWSIGIGLFPGDGQEFDTLLKNAHTAVDSAKEAGRNTYRFFAQRMNVDLVEQIRLTGGLAHAVRRREFLLHYQPQVDIGSGLIVGAEALVRWQHPEDGLLAPGKFIALAESSGHIVQIGEWVLNEACRQAKVWLDRNQFTPVMAVNLSALQFKHGNVLEMVTSALAVSGLPPDRLELELTESILLQDVDVTIKTLHRLKALGVKLSIDDFGTGYSSLSYLKRLAVDKLKIDQSFVRDMLTDNDGAAIVRAIVQLGHNLQLTVIAEGVETRAQWEFLAAQGCDEVQGYWLSRPVPQAAFGQLLQNGLSIPV